MNGTVAPPSSSSTAALHLPLAHAELLGDPLVNREHLSAFRWSRRSIVQDDAVFHDQSPRRVNPSGALAGTGTSVMPAP